MINLNNIEHFAQGGNRRCFVHPLKKDRCLKVSFKDQPAKAKKNAAWYKKLRSAESFDDNLREQSAYQQRSLKNIFQVLWLCLGLYLGLILFLMLVLEMFQPFHTTWLSASTYLDYYS